jgi:hypothetical protein
MSSNEQSRCLWGILLAILGAGCLSAASASRGYPLYAVSSDRPTVSQVATLSATVGVGAMSRRGGPSIFIKKVDGRDVSEFGATFELLPGCHVVEPASPALAQRWAPSDTVEPLAFVLSMQAGHAYTIVLDLFEGGVGGRGRNLYGVEQDSSWQRTATFQPVTPETAARACAPRVNSP